MKQHCIIFVIIFLMTFTFDVSGQQDKNQGCFFPISRYNPKPLPEFNQVRYLLPSPIFDENPLWVETYWRTWELACENFHEPAEGSGFISQYPDPAFNENIFLWDGAFMTMFLNVAHPLVPGISSLNNFYAKQYPTGEICREINSTTGIDFDPWRNTENLPLFSRWGFDEYFNPYRAYVIYRERDVPSPNPYLTLDALNHPILAWAEMESYHWTGDKDRLEVVRIPLIKYYEALKKYIRQGNGLYMTDWASMDNSPRNICLANGGTGIDISSEMVLFARNLSELSAVLGYREDAERFHSEAEDLAAIINAKMWDDDRKFYFDLTLDEQYCPSKTIAAYWTLPAEVAPPERAKHLSDQLKNPNTFGRLHPVPSLAADEKEYYPHGGYWSGAVWIATNTMVIDGLEKYGMHELAKEIALKHLNAMAKVYKETNSIWENYAADYIKEGINTNGLPVAKDLVGFSGVTPILHFIRYGIGLTPHAPDNELIWRINSRERSGCERFRFNKNIIDLIAEPAGNGFLLNVRSEEAFTLTVIINHIERQYSILKGNNSFLLEGTEP